MIEVYSSYRCEDCNREFVLLSEEAQGHIKDNRYLVCPYCSSQEVMKQGKADSLKECMSERSYIKSHGAFKQRR